MPLTQVPLNAAPGQDCADKGSTMTPALRRVRFAGWKEDEKEQGSHIPPAPEDPPSSHLNSGS